MKVSIFNLAMLQVASSIFLYPHYFSGNHSVNSDTFKLKGACTSNDTWLPRGFSKDEMTQVLYVWDYSFLCTLSNM